jgi:hypothetical protein
MATDHLSDFEIEGVRLGEGPVTSRGPRIRLSVEVAALLAETPQDPDVELDAAGYVFWHLERARLEEKR